MLPDPEPQFDFSAHEAAFSHVNELFEKRKAALVACLGIRSAIQEANSRLTTTRRYLIIAGANSVIPTTHDRMVLIPKARVNRVADVAYARVYTPLVQLGESEDPRPSSNNVFFGFKHGNGAVWRAVLSTVEFSAYEYSSDINAHTYNGEVTYTTRHPVSAQRLLGRLSLARLQGGVADDDSTIEGQSLDTLLDILYGYEPTPEDNQPLLNSKKLGA